MRNTTATREEAIRLAKSSRRDRNVRKETMLAVTATVNQKRTAIGSVQNNKTSVTLSSASELETAITRRVPAPGIANASVSLPFSVQRRCHLTVIMRNGRRISVEIGLHGNVSSFSQKGRKFRLAPPLLLQVTIFPVDKLVAG